MSRRVLVTGAAGQVASELVPFLRSRYGAGSVIAAGHKTAPADDLMRAGPYLELDCRDEASVSATVREYNVTDIYHLATILSGRGEVEPDNAWTVNVNGLKAVLDAAVKQQVARVFWPSSIAVFGPTTPRQNTPQRTVLEPTTMYGVTKVTGENLCHYYFVKYGLDVRSIRYPGLVTYKAFSGGGTTDYSVEMFFEAKQAGRYKCFVRDDTVLPLMYMDDAVRGTVELMEAERGRLTVRTSYNIASLSFSAGDLAREISSRVPGFTCTYEPDFRQAIADSWPQSLDDRVARSDWGWRPLYDLGGLVDAMLQGIASPGTPRSDGAML